MPSERMWEVFRMAKERARDKKDVDSVRCIENKVGELTVDLEGRLEVWKEYAEELLNQEHARGDELEADIIEGPVDIVNVEEVREAMQRMKKGRAVGPSGVPVEVIEECGLEMTIARIATDMLNGGSMPDSWRKSMLVPVYKGKGDPKKCGNYRSIKLLEHGMKVVERVFESRLRKVLDIDGNQLGFMPGRGTIDGIFAVRQWMEKSRAVDKDLCMVFVDLEKAFDRVPREVIWWALRRKGVSEKLVRGVQEMYKGAAMAVRLDGQHSEYFPVEVGVHQGSVLSPLLFAAIMDEATRDLEKGTKGFLYADDIVLLGKSWEEVGNRYCEWKEALEGKGLKVNVQKTKAMKLGGKKEVKAAVVDPCAVCRRRVMRNLICSTVCGGWVHKRCSRMRGSLARVVRFVCARCCGE